MTPPTLSQHQWKMLHVTSVEIHRAKSTHELIEITLHVFPKILGIHYTVWHHRNKTEILMPDKVFALPTHLEGVVGQLDTINQTIPTHPIFTGLQLTEAIELPEHDIVTMLDFASERQVRETAIYREAYRHIEIQMFKEHLAIAYKRLTEEVSKPDWQRKLTEILTQREKEVFSQVLNGKANDEIGTILGISKRTVEKHVSAILEKAGADNRKSLLASARYGY